MGGRAGNQVENFFIKNYSHLLKTVKIRLVEDVNFFFSFFFFPMNDHFLSNQ